MKYKIDISKMKIEIHLAFHVNIHQDIKKPLEHTTGDVQDPGNKDPGGEDVREFKEGIMCMMVRKVEFLVPGSSVGRAFE